MIITRQVLSIISRSFNISITISSFSVKNNSKWTLNKYYVYYVYHVYYVSFKMGASFVTVILPLLMPKKTKEFLNTRLSRNHYLTKTIVKSEKWSVIILQKKPLTWGYTGSQSVGNEEWRTNARSWGKKMIFIY